jgi:hypothetical protein
LTRNEAETIRMEIDGDVLELSGTTSNERKALIDSWVTRHSELRPATEPGPRPEPDAEPDAEP